MSEKFITEDNLFFYLYFISDKAMKQLQDQ